MAIIMKQKKRIAAALAVLMLLPAAAACKKDTEKLPPSPIEENGELATMRQADIPFNEAKELYQKYKDTAFLSPRGVLSVSALSEALGTGKENAVRIYGDAEDAISLEKGSYELVDFIFDAPNMTFSSAVPLGSLVFNSISAEPVSLKAQVKNVFVYGADVTLEISGGARLVCVGGQHCKVSVSGDSVPVILCLNASAVIENGTKKDIDIYLANGTVNTLPKGQTYGA